MSENRRHIYIPLQCFQNIIDKRTGKETPYAQFRSDLLSFFDEVWKSFGAFPIIYGRDTDLWRVNENNLVCARIECNDPWTANQNEDNFILIKSEKDNVKQSVYIGIRKENNKSEILINRVIQFGSYFVTEYSSVTPRGKYSSYFNFFNDNERITDSVYGNNYHFNSIASVETVKECFNIAWQNLANETIRTDKCPLLSN